MHVLCFQTQVTLRANLFNRPGNEYSISVCGINFIDAFFCRSEEHLPTYCRSDVVQFTVSDRLIVGFAKLIFLHRSQ